MENLITDASIMFAIIAINMTVIGLTSLAESKTIIGVDYGRFLLKKYKLITAIKMNHPCHLFYHGLPNVNAGLFFPIIAGIKFPT